MLREYREQVEDQRLGAGLAVATYFIWGTLPLFWKLLGPIDPSVVLAHRVIWSCIFLWLINLARGGGFAPIRRLASARQLASTVLSAILISANWGIYIWAVGHGMVTECSLGYFIAPLGYALIGILFFGERPSKLRLVSIFIAFAAVLLRVAEEGRLEPVSLLLMTTICCYGVSKKDSPLPAAESVFLETLILLPAAAAFIVWQWFLPTGIPLGTNGSDLALLVLAGPITAIPLLCYGESIKRISLTAQGVIQYLSPSLQFLLAVLVFGEPWSEKRLRLFGLIWISIGVYLFDSLRRLNSIEAAGESKRDLETGLHKECADQHRSHRVQGRQSRLTVFDQGKGVQSEG